MPVSNTTGIDSSELKQCYSKKLQINCLSINDYSHDWNRMDFFDIWGIMTHKASRTTIYYYQLY